MIEKTTLPGGVRLVSERLPHVRSASFGIWVGTGSRHEPSALAGASHALEHMSFKGAGTRTAAEIAELMDGMGGQLNAFTTKECTCFYGRALDTRLHEALGLICDIFFEPRMDEDDWQTERGVILEEIGMYRDSPEDMSSERLFSSVFKGSALARPVLGRPSALNAMTAAALRGYREAEYRPHDIVVSLAGSFDEGHLRFLERRFTLPAARPRAKLKRAAYTPARVTKKKAIEQNHWCVGFPGLPMGDSKRHTLQVLSGVVGGGMSSRLFQAVREREGLCYEIGTFTASHGETGVFGVYVGLGRESERRALGMIADILRGVAQDGPGQAEVDRAREQLKAAAIMGMESSKTRMNHMWQSELLLGRILTLDEIAARCDAVTAEGCRELAAELINFDKMSFSAIGRVDAAGAYDGYF
ncbi:MAG: insulinase family protein [Oscillospiraceae bacterium]|nr:insulinase family protein [Oscillospiraceae bacterium]